MMVMKSKGKNKDSGFSLVELMVTVGIIGVLASLAVPQYSKFSAKAKQAEAKTQLGSIYTVEKAFFVEANSYATCLLGMGYKAEGAQRRYAVGFATIGTNQAGSLVCQNAAGTATVTNITANVHYFGASPGMGPGALVGFRGVGIGAMTAGPNTFLAAALGNISGVGTTTDVAKQDGWSINQDQNLTNNQSGI